MKTVKNISNKPLAIPNIGIVDAGDTVAVPDSFHNPNFEVAKSGKSADTSDSKASENEADTTSKKKDDKSTK